MLQVRHRGVSVLFLDSGLAVQNCIVLALWYFAMGNGCNGYELRLYKCMRPQGSAVHREHNTLDRIGQDCTELAQPNDTGCSFFNVFSI